MKSYRSIEILKVKILTLTLKATLIEPLAGHAKHISIAQSVICLETSTILYYWLVVLKGRHCVHYKKTQELRRVRNEFYLDRLVDRSGCLSAAPELVIVGKRCSGISICHPLLLNESSA